MIEYVNLFVSLTMFESSCYVYYELKKFFYLISILIEFRDTRSVIRSTILQKNADSEVTKPKRDRKKKIETKMNEVDESNIRDKRERLVACVLSGNSKQYLGKEYTEQQFNEMDCTNLNTLLNR